MNADPRSWIAVGVLAPDFKILKFNISPFPAPRSPNLILYEDEVDEPSSFA